MKASIHFELETTKDFEAFAAIFSGVAKSAAPAADVVHAEAPKPEKQITAPKVDKPAKADKPVKADPKPEPEQKTEDDAVEAETVDKALVAKELRAFIQKKGEGGPKAALAVLKEFGATKFDELKAEDYSKFLTALSKE